MKILIDFSSRFRILKGGKISLMVSALALGSLVNIANAETIPVSTGNQLISNTSSFMNDVNIFNINIDDSITEYILKISETSKLYNIDNLNDVIFNSNDNSPSGGISALNLNANNAYVIRNFGLIKIDGNSSTGLFGIQASGIDASKNFNFTNDLGENQGILVSNTAFNVAKGIYINKLGGSINILNNNYISATSLQHHADGIDIYGVGNSGYEDIELTLTNSKDGVISARGGINAYGISITGVNNLTGTIENTGMISGLNISNELDYISYSLYDKSISSSAIFNNNYTVEGENTYIGTLSGNISWQGTLNNAGKISLPYNANFDNFPGIPYIETFTNKSTGILEINLFKDQGIEYSQIDIGTATFEDGSTINVNVLNTSTDDNLLVGTTLESVISSGNAIDIQGKLNITDNSTLLNFEYESVEVQGDGVWYDINLKAVEAKTIYDSVLLGGAQGSTKTTAKILQNIKDSGTYTQMSTIFTALNSLSTDVEVAKAVEETTPQTATSSVSASNHVAQGISNIVTQRQNINFGAGVNSGDEMFIEKNVWFKPYGSIGSQNDKDGINGFDINTYGLAFGIDGEYEENQTFGLGFFYTNANVEVNNVQQSSDLDVFSLVAYGSNSIIDNKTKFMYQLGYSLQKNDSSRFVSLTSDTATSDYTSKTASIDLKVLRDYRVNEDLLLQPMVSSTYRHFSNPSYSESGAGALNLDVEKFTTTELLVGLGTMAHFKIDDNSKIIGNVNVDYDLHDRTTTVTSSYQGASGVTFDTDGIDNGRWSYDVGIAYENQVTDLSNINFSYNYQGKGSDYSNNVISAKYTYKF